jgi:hypothetical protein
VAKQSLVSFFNFGGEPGPKLTQDQGPEQALSFERFEHLAWRRPKSVRETEGPWEGRLCLRRLVPGRPVILI